VRWKPAQVYCRAENLAFDVHLDAVAWQSTRTSCRTYARPRCVKGASAGATPPTEKIGTHSSKPGFGSQRPCPAGPRFSSHTARFGAGRQRSAHRAGSVLAVGLGRAWQRIVGARSVVRQKHESWNNYAGPPSQLARRRSQTPSAVCDLTTVTNHPNVRLLPCSGCRNRSGVSPAAGAPFLRRGRAASLQVFPSGKPSPM
jgi:hypothetical protein